MLRIVVGLYFVKSLVTKMTIVLLGGVLPVPAVSERWIEVMPKIVANRRRRIRSLFYKHFLEGTVLTHSELFAHLTAWGETAVGLGLTLGLLTGVASLIGLMLVINYGLATQWMTPGQQGFHLVLFVLMLAFFFARAGRAWGLDAWIAGGDRTVPGPKSLERQSPAGVVAERPARSAPRLQPAPPGVEAERPPRKSFTRPPPAPNPRLQDQRPIAPRGLGRDQVHRSNTAEQVLGDHQRPHIGVVERRIAVQVGERSASGCRPSAVRRVLPAVTAATTESVSTCAGARPWSKSEIRA